MAAPIPSNTDRRQIMRSATSDIEFADFGGPITTVESDPVAGVIVSEVVNQNSDRVQYLLFNNGTTVVWVSTRPTLSIGIGIPIAPNGGYIKWALKLDGSNTGWSLFAISSAAAQQMHLVESIRVTQRAE